jgi:hypothetical protein
VLQLKNIRISIKLIVVGTLPIVVAVWH